MSVSTTKSPEFMLTVEQVELPSSTVGLVSLLKRILSKRHVQNVEVNVGAPIRVTWFKRISDLLLDDVANTDPDDVLRNVTMTEFEGDGSPREALIDALIVLSGEGFFPTYIYAGDLAEFKNWLSIPRVVRLPPIEGTEYLNFMGMRLLEVPSLPKDCVVLLGAELPDSGAADARRALKIVT